jgi:preprotein translocase subunit YajC
MFISTAWATTTAATAANAPSAGEAFMLNMLLILILVALFYVLLIMPQQRRFKKHRSMMDALQKGDKVMTTGGFIGKIDKIDAEKHEVVIDFGNNVKITAARSAVQGKMDSEK